jgi:hypothetical protein
VLKFNDYLYESVKPFKRQSMKKFTDMSNQDFINFINQIKKDNGLIKNDFFGKLDGFPVTFGKNKEGKFFMESSSSGPKFIADFAKYTKQKTDDKARLMRADAYDQLFNTLENLKFTKSLEADTKIYCEVMANKIASESNGKLKFVTIEYDKNKLGSELTIFPYSVMVASTNDKHPNQIKLISSFIKSSNSKIKVIDAKLETSNIDVSSIIKDFSEESINKTKSELASFLLNSDKIKKNIIGSEIEGIVLVVNDVRYKITTHDYQNKKGKMN